MSISAVLTALALCATPTASPDADQDGALSLMEFRAWSREMVQTLDADNNGKVSSIEWGVGAPKLPGGFAARGFASTGQGSEPSLFMEIDVNGNGELSVVEIDELARSRFAVFDKNQDGVIRDNELSLLKTQLSR